MTTGATDADLVHAHLAGDRAALAAIYDRYAASLYDTAAALLRDPHDAADAVQDVFVNPRRSDRGPGSAKFANWFGTTLRIYDPSNQAWRVNWFNPHDGFRAELIGRRRGNQIVQEGTFPDGTPIRWTFSEMTHDSYRWRGERLEPDGKTWRLQVEFRGKRRSWRTSSAS